MLMPDNLTLIGNSYSDFGLVVQDDALASQAAFQPGIDSAVDEIFFLIGNLFQEFFTAFNVHMAGGAGAYAAAIVIQMNVVLLRNFEYRHILVVAMHRYRWDGFIFKLKFYRSHLLR